MDFRGSGMGLSDVFASVSGLVLRLGGDGSRFVVDYKVLAEIQ